MLVFIDDSGDAGFKIEKGSSRFFVISLVIFDDNLEAEKIALAIKEFKRELNFPDNTEFKFFKSSKNVKERFLKATLPFKFKIRNFVVDKTIIRSSELKENKNSFYSYAIKMALKYSSNSILNARIKIDGSGNRDFRRSFLTYLRKQLNSKDRKIIKDCRLVDSKDNVLIQLADMIAGSVRRSHDKSKKDADVYKKIIESKIEDEWLFK